MFYYIVFVNDRETETISAGVDLLAGPFNSEQIATGKLDATRSQFPVRSQLAELAHHLPGAEDRLSIRLGVVPISIDRVKAYNARHKSEKGFVPLPYPPPCIAPEMAVSERESRVVERLEAYSASGTLALFAGVG